MRTSVPRLISLTVFGDVSAGSRRRAPTAAAAAAPAGPPAAQGRPAALGRPARPEPRTSPGRDGGRHRRRRKRRDCSEPSRGTPARPQLPAAAAADYTIAKYLEKTGAITAGLTADGWNWAAGIGDVATFTATYTVGATGGTHTAVQAAVDAATTAGGTNRVYIRVMAGTYREIVCIRSTAPPITLYSTESDASQTVIVNDSYAGKIIASPVVGPWPPSAPAARSTAAADHVASPSDPAPVPAVTSAR